MFAPQGQGKSITGLLMSVAVDAGVNGLWETVQTPVLYINLERSARSLQRRLGCVNGALGLAPDRPLLTLNRRGRSLMDIEDAVKRSIEEHGVGMTVVDSISRTGFGDLTENAPTNAAIDTLNGLCDTWIGLGHTPRGSTEHVYGSTFWDAGADIMVRLSSERRDSLMGVRLEVTKANDIAIPPPMTLAYAFDHYGLHSVEKAPMADFPGLIADRPMTLGEELEDYLLGGPGKATATQAAKDLGKSRPSVSAEFANNDRFVRAGKVGREVFYGVRQSNV